FCADGANGSYGGTRAAAGGVDAVATTALGKDRRLRGRKGEVCSGGGSYANRVHADPALAPGEDAGAAVSFGLDPSCTVGADAIYGGTAAVTAGGVDAGPIRTALGNDGRRRAKHRPGGSSANRVHADPAA